jgi:hypothetical protein
VIQLRPRIERGAKAVHVAYVANRMRAADKDEVLASSGLAPFQALMQSVAVSDMLWTGFNTDAPICVFGVRTESFMEGIGIPWMLGTDEMSVCKRDIVLKSTVIVESMLTRYRRLHNYVDARNKASIRWLRWLGFTIYDPVPYGMSQLPFHKFEMIAHV